MKNFIRVWTLVFVIFACVQNAFLLKRINAVFSPREPGAEISTVEAPVLSIENFVKDTPK